MRGSGALSQKLTPLPIRQLPKRQLQRKYYTMRCDFFQGIVEKQTERKENMHILEELYYGNIRPDVKFYGKNSPFVELARLREKNRENLLKSLNEDEKETFEKFNEAQA